MNKLIGIVLAMLLPLLGLAQEAKKDTGPKKNTISSHRLLVKDGHDAAFKAALAAHAQKYHTGGWKWRVYDVLSGPDGGTYQIVEGPTSWTELEGRGDLGAEHMKDFETNIAPHVEKTLPESYLVYQADLSTVALSAFSTKASVTHYYNKPGRGPALREVIKAFKKSWEKAGVNVAVYLAMSSGEPQYTLVRRFKEGWKDYDVDGPTMGSPGTELEFAL